MVHTGLSVSHKNGQDFPNHPAPGHRIVCVCVLELQGPLQRHAGE